MSASLAMRPMLRQYQGLECRVCRQVQDTSKDTRAEVVVVALVGVRAYWLCPACRELAPEPSNQNYRRRVRRWIRAQLAGEGA